MSNAAPPGDRSNKRLAVAWTTVLAVFVVALLVRLPFVANPLLGEEGAFGRLVVGAKPVAWIVARGFPEMLSGELNGTEIFGPFQRNIMIYLTLDYPARWIGNVLWPTNGSFDSVSMNARLSYFLVFCCGIWVLGWSVLRCAGGNALAIVSGALLALYALSSPLLVGASLQPQIDGSIGIFYLGVAAFLLLKGDLAVRGGWLYFAAAGLCVGIGRPEWLIAMTGAAFAVGVAGVGAAFVLGGGRDAFRAAALAHGRAASAFGTGMFAGVMVSIAVSSFDFFAGFDVLNRVAATTGGADTVLVDFRSFWIPIGLIALFAAGVAATSYIYSARRDVAPPGAGQLIALIGGTGITIGFMLSGWGSDGFPRYFAPALMLVTVAAISLQAAALPRPMPMLCSALIIVGAVAGIAYSANILSDSYRRGVSISSYRGFELKRARERMAASARVAKEGKLIPLEFSSFGLYYPGLDFVSQDYGVEGAKGLISNHAKGREDALYQPKS